MASSFRSNEGSRGKMSNAAPDSLHPSLASLRVAELFAGVGGFRLGLEANGWEVVWSNQWEPATKRQHASEVYEARFGSEGHISADFACVLDDAEAGNIEIPDHELLVGGFPCQDYSVATSLDRATGIEGKRRSLVADLSVGSLKATTYDFAGKRG